jgi:hypothetical protein
MFDTNAQITGESWRDDPGPLADPVLPQLTPGLLAAYLGTEVVADDGTVWSGPGALSALEDAWVITAENPFSELREPSDNAAANARLVATIEATGLLTTPLAGRAPDLSWSEDCVAVRGASWEQICAWGREFDQHAVFLLTGETHSVVSCWTREELGRRDRVLRARDPEETA